MDNDGFISSGELFMVLKMMVGNNLSDVQLQQIVDKTILEADEDGDGKISFQEFSKVLINDHHNDLQNKSVRLLLPILTIKASFLITLRHTLCLWNY